MTRFPNGRDETTGILHRGYPTEKTGETVTVPIGNTVMEKGSYRHKTFPATVLDGKTKPPVTGCRPVAMRAAKRLLISCFSVRLPPATICLIVSRTLRLLITTSMILFLSIKRLINRRETALRDYSPMCPT